MMKELGEVWVVSSSLGLCRHMVAFGWFVDFFKGLRLISNVIL